MLRKRWGSGATIWGVLHSLIPALLIVAVSAVFVAMFWAGSRTH
jgi:hypothetical protein